MFLPPPHRNGDNRSCLPPFRCGFWHGMERMYVRARGKLGEKLPSFHKPLHNKFATRSGYCKNSNSRQPIISPLQQQQHTHFLMPPSVFGKKMSTYDGERERERENLQNPSPRLMLLLRRAVFCVCNANMARAPLFRRPHKLRFPEKFHRTHTCKDTEEAFIIVVKDTSVRA